MLWPGKSEDAPSEAAGPRNRVLQGPFQCYTTSNPAATESSGEMQIMKRSKHLEPGYESHVNLAGSWFSSRPITQLAIA